MTLIPCHTREELSRQSHGVQKNCRSPRCAWYDPKHLRSNAVGSHRAPIDGIRHAQNKRRGNAALKERSGIAVWWPWPRCYVSYNAVRPLRASTKVFVQTPWSYVVHCICMEMSLPGFSYASLWPNFGPSQLKIKQILSLKIINYISNLHFRENSVKIRPK